MIINQKNVRITAVLLTSLLMGCTRVTTHTEFQEVGVLSGTASTNALQRDHGIAGNNPSGQAVLVWEEPMVDVIDIPPGLDPEGHYYRPAHKSIVEIRQGRWQYYDRSKK